MHYRNRYYSAEVGRFANRDPIGYDGGDVNVYRYVENRPTMLVDPLGERPLWCWPLESTIRALLGTREEKLCWDYFVGGSAKTRVFRKGKFEPVVFKCGNFAEKIRGLEKLCEYGTRWEETTDSVDCAAGEPWKGCLGNYTAKITHSCVCGCLRYTVTMNDTYDFDAKYFNTHRTIMNELKTIGVNWAQAISMCGWKSYSIKGSHSGGTCH